jgi:hypothetical protein
MDGEPLVSVTLLALHLYIYIRYMFLGDDFGSEREVQATAACHHLHPAAVLGTAKDDATTHSANTQRAPYE